MRSFGTFQLAGGHSRTGGYVEKRPLSLVGVIGCTLLLLAGCDDGKSNDGVRVTSLQALEISPVAATASPGTAQQFHIIGVFLNDKRVDQTDNTTWTSSNPSVATIGDRGVSKGLAQAIAPGVTNIVASCFGKTVSTTLTVADAPNPTLETATVTLSQEHPTVEIPQFATVDLSSEPGLVGQTVTIEEINDSTLNALAFEEEDALQADLSTATSLRIVTAVSPSSDGIKVTFETQSTYSKLPDSQEPIAYAITSPDLSFGDGGAEFTPLLSDYDSATGLITATVPTEFFQQASDGSFQTNLKIGVATLFDDSGTSGKSTAAVTDDQSQGSKAAVSGLPAGLSGAIIPCAMGPSLSCTERSQFNPKRKAGTANGGKETRHLGVDLVAAPGTPLYAISEGVLSYGRSKAIYDSQAKTLSPCSQTMASGVDLLINTTVNGRRVTLQYFHLTDVGPTLVDRNNKGTGLIGGAMIHTGDLIGTTGQTGAAESACGGGPHLHFGMFVPGHPACAALCVTKTVNKFVFTQFDPFPFFVSSFKFVSPQDGAPLAKTTYTFKIEAKDSKGNALSSAVQNPVEHVPGDPTRKICLGVDNPSVLSFNPATPPFSGPNGNYCVPWATASSGVSASAKADSPDTTVTAKYTINPDKVTSENSLSADSAQVKLVASGNLPTCSDELFNYGYSFLGGITGQGSWSGTISQGPEQPVSFSGSGQLATSCNAGIYPGQMLLCADNYGGSSLENLAPGSSGIGTRGFAPLPFNGTTGTYTPGASWDGLGADVYVSQPGTPYFNHFGEAYPIWTGQLVVTNVTPQCRDATHGLQVNLVSYSFNFSGHTESGDSASFSSGSASNYYGCYFGGPPNTQQLPNC